MDNNTIHTNNSSPQPRNGINESNEELLSAARGAKQLYSSFISNIHKLKEETLSVLSQAELDPSKKNEYESQIDQWDSLIVGIEDIDEVIKNTINQLLFDLSLLVNHTFSPDELIEKEGFKGGLDHFSSKVPSSIQFYIYQLTSFFVLLGGNIIAIMRTRQKIISLFSTSEEDKKLLDYIVEKTSPDKKETNQKLDEILDAIKLRNKEDGYNAVTQERFAEICYKELVKEFPTITIKQQSLQRTFSNWDAHKYKTAIAEGFHEVRKKGESYVKVWAKTQFVPYYMKQFRGKYKRKITGESGLEEAAINKFKEEMQKINSEDNYVNVSERFLKTLIEIIENTYLNK